MESILQRIDKVANNELVTITTLEKKIGASKGVLSRALAKNTDIQSKWLRLIVENYPRYNSEWLLTGNGSMLKEDSSPEQQKKNIIKLHNDVASIGGREMATNGSEGTNWEYIDAGGWFPSATSAIRHYGESMIEYPSGCILVLKQIYDLENGFILGQNYVIEYGEDYNRVTKRIQRKGKTFMAYSSNEKTYADGTLIYQPFELAQIHKAWLVIGCVLKTGSNGVVQVK